MKIRMVLIAALLFAAPASAQPDPEQNSDPIRVLVGRLDLSRYKATIKGLTQFGDRRQGTARNRAAIDWIERTLKSTGCSNTERLTYQFGHEPPHRVLSAPTLHTAKGDKPEIGVGGARLRGVVKPAGVNYDPARQPNAKLRALDAEPALPGERQEVWCTKIGSTHPNEMYIVSAHMDGIGFGEAANDDGSGTALVMELARVLSGPDVHTDCSIRFILWNNEETGLNGAAAYVTQRWALQGKEAPAGSGRYPEPMWLGMIQHDMLLFDHGMPRANGSLSPVQRPEADINIEFQAKSKSADASQDLAWALADANDKYAGDYPATVGRHMTNTDSREFENVVAAVSVRENERGAQIGAGWDPQWHQPTDLYATYDDKDFRLGLNAAQTSLAAVAKLAGASIRK